MMRWVALVVLVVAVSATAAWMSLAMGPAPTGPGKVGLPAPINDAAGPPPVLQLDQDPTYSFGVMGQHKQGEHDWVIRNDGPSDLVLTGGSTSCSCTALNLTKGQEHRVKPGDAFTIQIGWNTKTFTGEYRQTAAVLTNDPRQPEITFVVKGEIRPALFMLPPEGAIEAGSVPNTEPKRFTALVTSPDRPETKILSITSSRPELLDVGYELLSEEDAKGVNVERGYRILATVKPTESLGPFKEEILLKTDHPDQPEVRLTIGGKIVGPVSFMPAQIRITGASPLQGVKTVVMIWVQGQEETEFTVVEKPDSLKVSIVPADDKTKLKTVTGRSYRLTASIGPGQGPGLVEGSIVLKTNHPKAGLVSVPVYILMTGEG